MRHDTLDTAAEARGPAAEREPSFHDGRHEEYAGIRTWALRKLNVRDLVPESKDIYEWIGSRGARYFGCGAAEARGPAVEREPSFHDGSYEEYVGMRTWDLRTLVSTFAIWYQKVRMSTNGSAHVGHDTSDAEQLRREVQLLRKSQASTMESIRNMLVEFTRNDGRSESGNAEGGAAVAQSPRGAIPTNVRESSAVDGNAAADVGESARGAISTAVRPTSEPAGERLVPDTRAGREAILRVDELRNLSTMGCGEAAVAVEIGPQRGQPNQPGRASERGAFSSGEFGGGFGSPSSRHNVFNNAVGPTFSGQKPDFNPWTKDARIHE